jgi:hypothetical protein
MPVSSVWGPLQPSAAAVLLTIVPTVLSVTARLYNIAESFMTVVLAAIFWVEFEAPLWVPNFVMDCACLNSGA